MGPKRSPRGEHRDNEAKPHSLQQRQHGSAAASSSHSNNSKNNSPTQAQQQRAKKTKSKSLFCCCGTAEDVYHREIPTSETYDSSPKEFSSPRSFKNQTSTSNGSTASVSVHSLPLPNQPIGTRNQQDATSESSKRVPTSTPVTASVASSSTRIRSKREIADVTELDTSVGSTEKKILPQTRSFTETQTNVSTSASAPASKPPQSRHELSKSNIPPVNTNTTNATTSGRDNSTLHGVYGTVAPVTATAAPNTGFIDMNRMYEVTNIKFDRSQPTSGEQIAALGDAHLAKLEEGCKVLLEKLLEEKQRRYLYLSDLNSAASSSSDDLGGGTIPPLSGDYTEVALIFTEVLQLQNRSKDAVQVLSKAIEILNTDLIHAKQHRPAPHSPNSTLPMSPHSLNTQTQNKPPTVSTAEFEQLKKMKGHCHRRLGSLYKLMARYPEGEEHIKKYISILNRQGNSSSVRKDKANAYALLATIFELMDRKDEAVLADKQALELASSSV